ncbi:cytochrome c [Nitrospira sp.]|nr:cytochrome c [Nitrospira sp.]
MSWASVKDRWSTGCLQRHARWLVVIMWMGAVWGCQPTPKAAGPVGGEDHIASGQALYVKHCAVCHGPRGKGDGARGLTPPPADLTSPRVATQLAPQLVKTVHKGREDTAMGSWEQLLSDQDIEDVLAYVRHLRR